MYCTIPKKSCEHKLGLVLIKAELNLYICLDPLSQQQGLARIHMSLPQLPNISSNADFIHLKWQRIIQISMPGKHFDRLFLAPTSGWLPKSVDLEGFPLWAGCHVTVSRIMRELMPEGTRGTFCGFRFVVWMLLANICPASSVGSQLALKPVS